MSSSLDARGIRTEAWHPWIKTFKKAEAIVAELDEGGSLARVSMLSAEEVAALRNIARDNFNSFPGSNLSCPVLAVPDVALWSQPEALWNAALAVTPTSPLAYKLGDVRRLNRLRLASSNTWGTTETRSVGEKSVAELVSNGCDSIGACSIRVSGRWAESAATPSLVSGFTATLEDLRTLSCSAAIRLTRWA